MKSDSLKYVATELQKVSAHVNAALAYSQPRGINIRRMLASVGYRHGVEDTLVLILAALEEVADGVTERAPSTRPESVRAAAAQ